MRKILAQDHRNGNSVDLQNDFTSSLLLRIFKFNLINRLVHIDIPSIGYRASVIAIIVET